jgi:hypothetical protein
MEEKYENLIWLFCILIILGLSFKVYNTSSNADCNKCMVSFTNKANYGESLFDSGEIQASKLYSEYLNGRCLLTWDKWEGFKIKTDILS